MTKIRDNNREKLLDECGCRRHRGQRLRGTDPPDERLYSRETVQFPGEIHRRHSSDIRLRRGFPGREGYGLEPLEVYEGIKGAVATALAISLGGDADTLAAIAGPMAYAFYREMPDSLVYAALKKLPEWMISVNERFDKRITEIHAE